MNAVIEKGDIVKLRGKEEVHPDWPDFGGHLLLEVLHVTMFAGGPLAACVVLRHTYPRLCGAITYRRIHSLELIESP